MQKKTRIIIFLILLVLVIVKNIYPILHDAVRQQKGTFQTLVLDHCAYKDFERIKISSAAIEPDRKFSTTLTGSAFTDIFERLKTLELETAIPQEKIPLLFSWGFGGGDDVEWYLDLVSVHGDRLLLGISDEGKYLIVLRQTGWDTRTVYRVADGDSQWLDEIIEDYKNNQFCSAYLKSHRATAFVSLAFAVTFHYT